jgi:single-strand DNA-binding protein
MAGSVNKVILVGNLGKDPEIREFENGGMIATFTLATKESYWDREKNERVDQPTDWHNVVIRSAGLAKVAKQYLSKGRQVYVEGKLRTRSYQTKEGETRYVTEVVVSDMVLLGSGQGGGQQHDAPSHTSPAQVHDNPAAPDDLPF